MIEVYGHQLEPTEPPEENMIVTDVIILARAVVHEENGRISDTLMTTSTKTTTGMIQSGMLSLAQYLLECEQDYDEEDGNDG